MIFDLFDILGSFHGSIKQLSPLWFSALQILAALASGFQTLSPELGSQLHCVWGPSVSRGLETLPWQELMLTTNWYLPLALAIYLYKDWNKSCCSCSFSTLLERSSRWRAERGILCLEENLRTGLQIVICFQEMMLWVQLLYLFISFMVTTVPCD